MKKIWLLLLALFGLSACGFTPLYANDPEIRETLSRIYIEPIDGVAGIKLRNQIETKLFKTRATRKLDPLYTLKVKLSSKEKEMAIRPDETATLISSTHTADITLTERASKKVLLTDKFNVTTSRNVLSDPYATVTSQEAGLDRSINILAGDISVRLTLFFKNQEDEAGE